MAPPIKFAHVVYQTYHLDEMVDWYVKVLECKVQHQNSQYAFLTYDDEHHRLAFVSLGPAKHDESTRKLPESASIYRSAAGVHHLAYTWKTLADLMDVYKRLKAMDIHPLANIRHGLTLSMYFADPDGNSMEFQVDVLHPDDANDFMRGPAYEANPVGETFNPEELIAAMDAGKPVLEIALRSDQTVPPGGLALELS